MQFRMNDILLIEVENCLKKKSKESDFYLVNNSAEADKQVINQ